MGAVLVELGGMPAATSFGVVVLAQQEAPPPGKGPEFGKASPLGLVVVLLLAVATVLLIRSMSKRIRRLPASFDRPEDQAKEDQAKQDSTRPAARDTGDAGGGRA